MIKRALLIGIGLAALSGASVFYGLGEGLDGKSSTFEVSATAEQDAQNHLDTVDVNSSTDADLADKLAEDTLNSILDEAEQDLEQAKLAQTEGADTRGISASETVKQMTQPRATGTYVVGGKKKTITEIENNTGAWTAEDFEAIEAASKEVEIELAAKTDSETVVAKEIEIVSEFEAEIIAELEASADVDTGPWSPEDFEGATVEIDPSILEAYAADTTPFTTTETAPFLAQNPYADETVEVDLPETAPFTAQNASLEIPLVDLSDGEVQTLASRLEDAARTTDAASRDAIYQEIFDNAVANGSIEMAELMSNQFSSPELRQAALDKLSNSHK